MATYTHGTKAVHQSMGRKVSAAVLCDCDLALGAFLALPQGNCSELNCTCLSPTGKQLSVELRH